MGDQASFHHPLQGATSLDVVSFDEKSSCTIPESVFLDFYLAGSRVSNFINPNEELKEPEEIIQ